MLSCKEKYAPNIKSPETGYLVVEGFINSNGITNIKITRTTKLIDSAKTIYEDGAKLFIESDGGESYPLQASDSGRYHSDSLHLNNAKNYCLHIITSYNQEYYSDYSTVRYTPPIDSISWERSNSGVHIYINTHDDAGSTKYYLWNYTETWEYHSGKFSILDWIYDNSVPVAVTESSYYTDRYICWKTVSSSNILLGSSEKLSEDRIHLVLQNIERASEKLSVKYSILIWQYAVSHEAFLFYEKLKKNTEQVGSIFDAQPSELAGNIHNKKNPKEIIIGFIETSTLQNKRIFISRNEVPDWGFTQSCSDIKVPGDSIRFYGVGLLPVIPNGDYINASNPECVDCTLKGGTIFKPDFWP